jgi:hypothetical protein
MTPFRLRSPPHRNAQALPAGEAVSGADLTGGGTVNRGVQTKFIANPNMKSVLHEQRFQRR